MAVTYKTQIALWTRAAGRCQYRGCNRPLLGEAISGRRLLNTSYIAHIVGIRGPRADPVRSLQLENDVGNLMLLCDAHHRLIDRDGKDDHPEALLLAMKEEHERRIELVTGVTEDRSSHVLLYAAKVGTHDCPARFDLAKQAMLPARYPAEERAIQLEIAGVDFQDCELAYWLLQQTNLRRQFNNLVRARLSTGEIKHLSVFAIAPQPLLVELGSLLGEITSVSVRQLQREPQTWEWRPSSAPTQFITSEAQIEGRRVALKLGVSATITDDRITSVLGEVPIWSVTTPITDRETIRSEEDLKHFRQTLRATFDAIKARHGEEAEIHVFPALPVSAAVELGRVWMPKADLPLVLYDQDRTVGGFVERLTIGRRYHDTFADNEQKEEA